MYRKITFLFVVSLIFLFSCSSEQPDIRAVSELTREGNYLIKWETFPTISGNVKIFSSANSNNFDSNSPSFMERRIEQGYAELPPLSNTNRTYFKLLFNDKYSIITSERVIPTDKLFNFRDLGGYTNKDYKQLKWGKIYRSSSLEHLNGSDREHLKQLGIKTVLDLRGERQYLNHPPLCDAENIYNLPLRGNPYNVFFDQILSGQIQRSDIINHLEELFYFFAENNSDYLIQIFDILLEEENYPIVICCSLGKDRSAMVAALVLAALDVNDNTIVSDYLLSNDLIDYHAQAENAYQFNPEVQETLTALFSSHREIIVYTLEKIKEEYGSMDNYLKNELKLTPDKRNKLKELLLYP